MPLYDAIDLIVRREHTGPQPPSSSSSSTHPTPPTRPIPGTFQGSGHVDWSHSLQPNPQLAPQQSFATDRPVGLYAPLPSQPLAPASLDLLTSLIGVLQQQQQHYQQQQQQPPLPAAAAAAAMHHQQQQQQPIQQSQYGQMPMSGAQTAPRVDAQSMAALQSLLASVQPQMVQQPSIMSMQPSVSQHQQHHQHQQHPSMQQQQQQQAMQAPAITQDAFRTQIANSPFAQSVQTPSPSGRSSQSSVYGTTAPPPPPPTQSTMSAQDLVAQQLSLQKNVMDLLQNKTNPPRCSFLLFLFLCSIKLRLINNQTTKQSNNQATKQEIEFIHQ